ncbi:MAG: sodium:alanine symporter family protein [Oscillospiraceae bacterium]|nr:sodium:alanine symporter family protein [Oscillospiraceae bacterium]
MEILSFINNNIVWGVPMLSLMVFTGAFFSIKTRFFQLRKFPSVLKSTVFSKPESRSKEKTKGESTPFEAMCQALAATLGTGNIAGVGTALCVGGAGAVFWMWICSIFGMMTGFAENVLGFLYRKRDKSGEWHGGAMYYIQGGLEKRRSTRKIAKPLALIYAALCTAAGFGMGNAAQMNSAAQALEISFGTPAIITGIALAALAAIVIFGGKKRVWSFCSKIVPIMSGFYIIGSLYIIFTNIENVPGAFKCIFSGAFGLSQIGGGIFGAAVKTAISMGFKRGAFSNEAGLGTSVFAHTSSSIKSAKLCGMWSIFEIFFDTIVMCTLTAAVLLSGKCTPLPTADAALRSVSAQTSYFRLTDSEKIISEGVELDNKIRCISIYGEEFYADAPKGLTYSNIFEIKAEFSDQKVTSATITAVSGAGLASFAFSGAFGKTASGILAVLTAMFAFSTVIGWSYFGAEAISFLFGQRAVMPFRIVFIAFSVVGAVIDLRVAWAVSDLLNGLMALPNLIAVLILSKEALKAIEE